MLRKLIEAQVGKMTDCDFKQTLDLAMTDIKINRVGFGKWTSLRYVVEIAEICYSVLQKTKKAA